MSFDSDELLIRMAEVLAARSAWEDDCLIWTARRTADGYGSVSINNKEYLAHRVAWLVARGPIPNGLCVCHKCDTPACINAEHLFLGTQADNMADMKAKGRGRNSTGENNPKAKLNPDSVRKIRERVAAGVDSRDIADEFGIYRSTVYKIASGETWRHV